MHTIALTRSERTVLQNTVAGSDYRAGKAWYAERSVLASLGLLDAQHRPTALGFEIAELS
jgi:hypothetical protein